MSYNYDRRMHVGRIHYRLINQCQPFSREGQLGSEMIRWGMHFKNEMGQDTALIRWCIREADSVV